MKELRKCVKCGADFKPYSVVFGSAHEDETGETQIFACQPCYLGVLQSIVIDIKYY